MEVKKRLLLSAFIIVLFSFLRLDFAQAFSSIEQKALAEGIMYCYTFDNNRPPDVVDFGQANLSGHLPSMFTHFDYDRGPGKGKVPIPNGYYDFDNNFINCSQLFSGYKAGATGMYGKGNFPGLAEMSGQSGKVKEFLQAGNRADQVDLDTSEILYILNFLGYIKVDTAPDETICLTYFADTGRDNNDIEHALCNKNGTEGKVDKNSLTVEGSKGSTQGITFSVEGDDLKLKMYTYWFVGSMSGANISVDFNEEKVFKISSYDSFQSLVDDINSAVQDFNNSEHWDDRYKVNRVCSHNVNNSEGGMPCIGGEGSKMVRLNDTPNLLEYAIHIQGNAKRGGGVYTRREAAIKAINNFLGSNFHDEHGFNFSSEEEYALYMHYINDVFNVTSVCDQETVETQSSFYLNGGGYKEIYYLEEDGTAKKCFVKPGEGKENIKVNGVGEAGHFDGTQVSFSEVVDAINKLVEEKLDPDKVGEIVKDEAENNTQPKDGILDMCKKGGAAKAIGWILCPIMEWMVESSKNMYDDYIEPSLVVQTDLYDNSSAVKGVWSVFQGFANVFFVILFLIVIFSQLTGMGIDNYGIKKILPKLIVAAVLVNLSYYICMILVDLSNVVGNGINDILSNMSTGGIKAQWPIPGNGGVDNIQIEGSSIGTTAWTAVPLLGALAGAGLAIWANPAMLLSLVVAVLGVLISVFFMFILLSARQVAIVVLIVLSPLAFACYMLPNTKKLFDKWVKIGEALLLLYPISSLLIAGGSFVSRLLLSGGIAAQGFVPAFTAIIVGIVPVFFIPSLLKGAFVAMGNIGAKVSGFGQKVGSGAQRRLQNSDTYKSLDKKGSERKTRWRAGLDAEGKEKDLNRLQRFMRGGSRGIGKARSQFLADQDAKNRDMSLMGVGLTAAMIGKEKKMEADQVADYMTLINKETRNGEDEKSLFDLYDKYMNEDNKFGAVAVARIAGRRKDTASRFLSQKVTGKGLDEDAKAKLLEANKGHADIFRGVAKEVSTGENSAAYKESSPLGFEFAAQHNKDGNTEVNYAQWLMGKNEKGEGNVDSAMERYVTNSRELVGMKNSELEEIVNMMNDPNSSMSLETKNRLRGLASETIKNRGTTGVWDTTKADNIYKIAGTGATSGGDAKKNTGSKGVKIMKDGKAYILRAKPKG